MTNELINIMASIDARLAKMESMAAISMKTMLTVKEAAIYVGISEDRVRHLMCSGAISYHKGSASARSYIAKKDLDAFLTGTKYRSDTEIREESERMYAAHMRKQRERKSSTKAI